MKTSNLAPYKIPFVYLGKDDAFVSVSWYNRTSAEYEREKLRLGIKGLTKSKKRDLLNDLCSEVKQVVKLRNANGIYHDEQPVSFQQTAYKDTHILEVFQLFKDDKDNPDFQRKSAGYFITRFSEFIEMHPGTGERNISFLTVDVFREYVKYLQHLELVGKTINNHIWVLGKVMEKVTESSGTKFSFDPEKLRVKQMKNESELYKPLSFEEKDSIFNYFKNGEKQYHNNYYSFLLFIYYTCIRPAEIMRLQIQHISLQERTIYVPWFKSKNGLSKYVQILDPLYSILSAMKLSNFDQEDYLFSHMFSPGPIKKTSKNLSELWTTVVKELQIVDKQMYGLKHTFNRDYVENNKRNIDWEWLRRHNRHATIQQTQDYISGLTAYFLDETQNKIIDHT